MYLTFTSPGFLSLLPLAALPVLFHLFYRLKKKPHDVTSLMFFHRIAPRFSARKRIREWLILLLRFLLLLLIILALAGPVWQGAGGGKLALAVIVDNSASMTGRAETGDSAPQSSRFDRALGGAAALIDKLDAGDIAAILPAVDDPALVDTGALLEDREKLTGALARIGLTDAAARPARALRRAAARLAESDLARREIHIFTDLQSNEWGRNAAETPGLSAQTKVVVHRIPAAKQETPNVALRDLRLPAARLVAGRPIPVRIELTNTGTDEVTVNLNTLDRVGNTGTHAVRLASGATRSITAITTAPEPGRHWFKAWVSDDSFSGDNVAYAAFRIRDRARVRFLGERSDYGLLPAALVPSDGNLSGLQAVFGPPEELAFGDDSGSAPPVLVISTTARLAAARTQWPVLETLVQEGCALLVVAGPDANREALPHWTGVEFAAQITNDEGSPLVAYAPRHPLFADLLDDDEAVVDLAGARAFAFNEVRPTAEAATLMGLADGRLVLTETRHGEGRVFAAGLAFTPEAGNLVLKPAFLAIGQSLALLSREIPANAVTVAGAPLRLPPDVDETALIHLKALEGTQLDWKGAPADIETLPRAGVYLLDHDGRQSWIGVRADPNEGEQAFIEGAVIASLEPMTYQIFEYTGPAAMDDYLSDVQRAVNLFPWFALAALICLLAEGLLANTKERTSSAHQTRQRPSRKTRGAAR